MPGFASFDWYEINSSAIDTNNGRNKLWGNPELTSILQNARGSFVIKFSTGTTGKELVSIYKDSKILKNWSPILITFQQWNW